MQKLGAQEVLKFIGFLNDFGKVERIIYIPGTKNRENDIEHSYHLAMLAWYIASNITRPLNKELLLKYALIHDLVEVYAGDTYIYSTNQDDHDSKKEREETARLRIIKEFPLFEDLHTMIEQYEKKTDEESRFIYVLDKIHPVFQIFLDNGEMWREKKVTLEMLFRNKRDKIALSEDLLPLWKEMEEILLEKEKDLFFKN